MSYFENLLQLLLTERGADRRIYQLLTQTASVPERRANGLTWYPVAIRGSEFGRGDYLTVELERTTHQDIPHQFRFGAAAALFSNHDAGNCRVEGTITHISGNRMKVTLKTDELPEWSRNGKLGVDLLFDENSYDEMEAALKQAVKPDKPAATGRLVDILTGEKTPTFAEERESAPGSVLNRSQRAAVQKILSANELAIVHGPPGTGKTTTLVEAICAMIAREDRQILVVAPSNTAVDLLSEKLAAQGLNVLRVGNPARVSERLLALTLDNRMSAHPGMKDARELKKRANEYRNMAHKYKRNFGRAERDQRKALFDEAHKIMKEIGMIEQFVTDDLLAKAQVITATLVGATHYTVRELRYHTVVIDEAGQALEPACWIPILKAQKVVLAGDHLQLPPTIKSEEAARKGLATTLLEKCVALHPGAVTLLEEQYRMNTRIMGYSSDVFYHGRLRAHASVASRVLYPGDNPLVFIDTAGCGFEEKAEGTSTTNPEEAAFIVKHLAQLLAAADAAGALPSVAVISPYKQQLPILNGLVQQSPSLQPHLSRISVNTIDSFQGQERDVVYIGLTRSNAEGVIGFLSDTRRMNVAMTRARKKLVVTGDSATLSGSAFYRNFITYVEENGAYQTAWEFMEA
ncbi:AAA domain-containing protein [Hufsiella ginkgonis]|uniref:AAA family ATPase n=1 Tax=Hufsiella ginkgonis TaxID=2695274 RepID=A0A7K1XZD7_9SPHI|nr:AAA domain-containing protein [Hufsiella ginkgonis]MXV16099.1 AAA family ATPase [Hufsiella ginkgonis]